jgi:phage terminase large subunit-like protein
MAAKKKKEAPKNMMDEFAKAIRQSELRSDTQSFGKNRGAMTEEEMWLSPTLLTFADFCASADHMNFPTLSDKQKDVADYMFGDDPKKMFDNGRNTAVLVWGKGGGKDLISALMQLYIVYILLNMRYPQRFLGQKDRSSLDLLNVASNKDQAQTVYFDILKTHVKDWKWLKNKWNIVVNGRHFTSQGEHALDETEVVTITNDAILFPKNIRMFSGSSEAESLEGKNLITFVLDEADAFKQESLTRSADKIYRTVRTSAVSRFKGRFKGFIISYPRSKDGFMMRMLERAKGSLSFYADVAKTWEARPRTDFSPETFRYAGYDIPIDFFEEFRDDPITSKAAYLCEPPDAQSSFFEDPAKVEAAAARTTTPLFEFRDEAVNNFKRKHIIKYPGPNGKQHRHVLTFDLSETSDATALCMAYRQQDKIIIDMITDWVPDKKRKIRVDLRNVEDIIEEIRKHSSVSQVAGDPWNSALIVQTLRGKGVNAKIVKLDLEDYRQFKRLLYAGHIQLPDNERLLHELKNLQLISGRKVDHPMGMHNDLAVTVIMAVKLLLDEDREKSVNLLAEGEYVSENLQESGEIFDTKASKSEFGIMIDGIEL